jgi:hypothetical protein
MDMDTGHLMGPRGRAEHCSDIRECASTHGQDTSRLMEITGRTHDCSDIHGWDPDTWTWTQDIWWGQGAVHSIALIDPSAIQSIVVMGPWGVQSTVLIGPKFHIVGIRPRGVQSIALIYMYG